MSEIHSAGAWLDLYESKLSADDSYVPTGFDALDKALADDGDSSAEAAADTATRGILGPAVVVLGAEPKAGKSQLSQVVATHRASQGDFVFYLDLENGAIRFYRRMLCRRAEIGMRALRKALRGHGSDETLARVREAKAWLRGLSLYVGDDPTIGFQDILGILDTVREADSSRKIFVVVDSLQRLPPPPATGRGHESQRTEIEAWMSLFERIKRKYDCVVWAVSELSRPATSKDDGGATKPGGHRYKGSGRIEYAADVSLSMTGDGDLRIEWNRDGARGDVARYEKVRPHYGIKEVPTGATGGATTGTPAKSTVSASQIRMLDSMAIGEDYSVMQLARAWGLGDKADATAILLASFVGAGYVLEIDVAGGKAYRRWK